ncbi:hypothetical protein SXCC_00716 [Gluconacetobacter sp. SXCC-1]|nr:hypothetical protein SXCC_00716 [Gluconacetobacter sp. SXCC-1]
MLASCDAQDQYDIQKIKERRSPRENNTAWTVPVICPVASYSTQFQ